MKHDLHETDIERQVELFRKYIDLVKANNPLYDPKRLLAKFTNIIIQVADKMVSDLAEHNPCAAKELKSRLHIVMEEYEIQPGKNQS